MVKYNWPVITEEMKEAVVAVLEGNFHPPGEQTIAFEEEFAKFCGAKHAIALSSGTAALHLSALALGIKKGDEVITPSNSMSSSGDSILFVGATPIFVDIDEKTYNIDSNKIEEKITSKTKAIQPVHMYGYPVDMDPILELAEEKDLLVFDDACHSNGCKYKKNRIGNMGDITSFSFVSKSMTVGGDGGMVATNNEDLAESVYMLRRHGRNRKGDQVKLGYNYRIGEMAAAIGRLQLKKLDKWNDQRRIHAKLYSDLLEDTPVKCPIEMDWAHPVYLNYVITAPKRDDLKKFLHERGIQSRNPYPPLHTLPYYIERFGDLTGKMPLTENHQKNALGLPVYPTMTTEDIEEVANIVKDFYKNHPN